MIDAVGEELGTAMDRAVAVALVTRHRPWPPPRSRRRGSGRPVISPAAADPPLGAGSPRCGGPRARAGGRPAPGERHSPCRTPSRRGSAAGAEKPQVGRTVQGANPSRRPAPRCRRRPGRHPCPETAADGPPESDGAGAGEARSASGTLGVSSGIDGGDTTFPYAYYLTRLLGLIESNWFRPPSAAGTGDCRVLCRLDRSGRLLDTGIEESSGISAFDRAALRVYSSAPLPPLPQGWVGSTLTLHLEFGP